MKEVAVKIITARTSCFVPESQWVKTANQLKICQSPNVVTLLDSFSDHDGVYLVLER